MAPLSNSPHPCTQTSTSSSTSQPLTRENVLQHTKSIAMPSRKPTAQRPPSPERTFLCQDKNYPLTRPKSTQSIQRAYANSSPSVHWRGDEKALFKLDPAAKYNIRDYLAEQCKAYNETTNELTNPTGTKVVFVLQFDDKDREQEALCVLTTRATLHGIYNFRDADNNDTTKQIESPALLTGNMQNEAAYSLLSSRGSTSFSHVMASAHEDGFPLADRELDSDSDDKDGHRSAPSLYLTVPDTITEGDEDEETNNGFVDVIDHGVPKYCRDPEAADHPECHGRFKSKSHAHYAIDAVFDFQERFIVAQNGSDSAAYYRTWRSMKLEYGKPMVHGQSSLRNAISTLDDSEEDDEIDDLAGQLLRLVAAKYGPLTLEGQRTKPAELERECSEECNFKLDKFLDQDLENDSWLSNQSFDDEHEELVSEPGTIFDGVADFSEDESLAFAPEPAAPQIRVVTAVSEGDLQKISFLGFGIVNNTNHMQILDTPHEDFVNHYVRRYEAIRKDTARKNAARATQARDNITHSAVPKEAINDISVAAVDTAPENIVALPTVTITAATPSSSSIKEDSSLYLPAVVDYEYATHPTSDTLPVALGPAFEKDGPLLAGDVTPTTPTVVDLRQVTSVRPISAQGSCSSRDGSAVHRSVFSRQASVTTKPSNESFGSDCWRLVDALDLQVDVKSAPTTVSHHDRSVDIPVLVSSASDTCETSTDVPKPIHSAHAQPTYARPVTPVRITVAGSKCLTPIIEVQTPLSSPPMLQAMMCPITNMDDPPEALSTKFEYQHTNIHIPSLPSPSREEYHPPVQYIPASKFTDDSSFTTHRQRSNKLATLKYQAQAFASATKRVTRRVLRSAKKLRNTARYLGSVTFGSRNPYETFARG